MFRSILAVLALSLVSTTAFAGAPKAKTSETKGAIFHVTHNSDDAHRVVHALRRATRFAKSSIKVIVYLDVDAAQLVFKDGKDVTYKKHSARKLLTAFTKAGGHVFVCGGCLKAAGKTEADLMFNAKKGTPSSFFDFADKIITFDY